MTVATEAPSRSTRIAVYAFLTIFVVCGFASIEAWPFSSFKLFSQTRSAERVTWSLEAITRDGEVLPIELKEESLAYGNTILRAAHFDDYSRPKRDEVCRAWATPLVEDGTPVRTVRVYRTIVDVRPGAPPSDRELVHECRVP